MHTHRIDIWNTVCVSWEARGFFFPFGTFSLLRLLVVVVVGDCLVGGRRVPGVADRRALPLWLGVPLSVADVIELVLGVQLHVHPRLHPQPLGRPQVLAVAGRGGLRRPVRLHVIGH